jgi:prophage DNA circulation protein
MGEDRLFKAMQTLQREVAAVRGGIVDLTDVVRALQSGFTTLQNGFTTLQSAVSSLDGALASVQADVREIRRDVSDLRAGMTEHLNWHLGQGGT